MSIPTKATIIEGPEGILTAQEKSNPVIIPMKEKSTDKNIIMEYFLAINAAAD